MSKNGYLARRAQQEREKKLYAEVYSNIAKQMALDVCMKLAALALNEEFGIGGKRLQRFVEAYNDKQVEFAELAKDDYDGAVEKLSYGVQQILGENTVEVKIRV